MGRWKKYTTEKLIAARKIVEAIDYNEFGAMARAAEQAYMSKEFPDRSLSGLNSLMARARDLLIQEKAEQEEKERREAQPNEEQVMFYCTNAISENVLREKHNAEKALLLLKRSIIDDAIGVRYDELKFCLKSIERAAKFIWPDDYAERLSELYAEEDY